MENPSNRELDYCDLEPGKICDNCCRCLDIDKSYNEIEADFSRTDHIEEIGEGPDLLFDDGLDDLDEAYGDEIYEDEAYESGEGEDCDSSRVAPLEIDPALQAEWEERLRAYEAEQKAAYIRTLHGARKKDGQ